MRSTVKGFLLLGGIVIGIVLWIIWGSFRSIHRIEVIGNEYLSKQEILKALPTGAIKISDVSSSKLVERIKENPFVKEVSFETRWIHTLVIRLTVYELVGKVFKDQFVGYLTEKGEILSPKGVEISPHIPEIHFFSGMSEDAIRFFANQLAIFRYSYEDFFNNIQRINLQSMKNVGIFIKSPVLGGFRKYELPRSPLVRDFIEIAILDEKYTHGSTIVLGANSVIVKD